MACRLHRKIKPNLPLACAQSAPAAIKFNAALLHTTEAGSRPGRRGTFFCFAKRQVPKEKATRLSASLRYVSLRSGQTCVTQFSLRCRPTRFAAHRSAQTNGGKSDHEALALFGANARSLNRVPQAQPDGLERTACKICDEISLKSRH